MTCLLNRDLIEKNVYNDDVINRAKYYIKNMGVNIGAYSDPPGYKFIRENVAKFIAKRDGSKNPTNPTNIILSNGCSEAIHLCTNSFISDSRDGVFLPVP